MTYRRTFPAHLASKKSHGNENRNYRFLVPTLLPSLLFTRHTAPHALPFPVWYEKYVCSRNQCPSCRAALENQRTLTFLGLETRQQEARRLHACRGETKERHASHIATTGSLLL